MSQNPIPLKNMMMNTVIHRNLTLHGRDRVYVFFKKKKAEINQRTPKRGYGAVAQMCCSTPQSNLNSQRPEKLKWIVLRVRTTQTNTIPIRATLRCYQKRRKNINVQIVHSVSRVSTLTDRCRWVCNYRDVCRFCYFSSARHTPSKAPGSDSAWSHSCRSNVAALSLPSRRRRLWRSSRHAVALSKSRAWKCSTAAVKA